MSQQTDLLLQSYDADKDGRLNLQEFTQLYSAVKQVYADFAGERIHVNVAV